MSEKERISSNYMEQQKSLHSHKALREIKYRTAVITGAEKPDSIGEAIEIRLRRMGYEIVLCPPKAELDVTIYRGTLEYFVQEPEVDTLICCHGVAYLDWLEFQPANRIREVIEVNLLGNIFMARSFVGATVDREFRKQIIFIGSMAYNHVLNASAPYCASKAGLAHFTRCLAWELAPKAYDVYCIHPSNTYGAPMTEDTIKGIMHYRGCTREQAEAYWGAVLPRKEWLRPEDVANTVEVLIRGNMGYMSGCNIELAGGQR